MSRELWETVAGLVESLAVPQAERLGLTITGMTVELPVELVVVQTEVGFRLWVDAPHFRWDAGLRPAAGRLQLGVQQMNRDELALFTGSDSAANLQTARSKSANGAF